MPVLNRIAGFADEMTDWRRHLHTHPELGLDCHETARFIETRLRSFGVDQIETGIAESGLVALIEGQRPGPTIGLRADMDALPIAEATGVPYMSSRAHVMHACGHDGHSAMLLGAARYLAETRNFAGRVALIFQPAEEGPGGAEIMVEQGIFDRFGISRVFALHTKPGLETGHFATTPGPIMAATDTFEIHVEGRGGHAAMPHQTRDVVIATCAIVQAIQTIVSRNHDPVEDLALSVTQIHTGQAENVIPDTAYINGTIRSFSAATREKVYRRLPQIVAGQAAAFEVTARCEIEASYPATINDATETDFAVRVAREIAGEAAVRGDMRREMIGEDFCYMLAAAPGAFVFLGQGVGPPLHHPEFDFNDAVAPVGASFFARLIETALPLEN